MPYIFLSRRPCILTFNVENDMRTNENVRKEERKVERKSTFETPANDHIKATHSLIHPTE